MSSFSKAMNVLAPNAIYTAHNGKIVEWKSDDITQPSASAIATKVAEFDSAWPLELLRIERDRLLAETDWWASSDLTMTDEQTTYRQTLRDITDTYSSMDDEGFAWPTKP